ncbi:MAG: hypothetical protein CM15mP116_00320 [Synechococcus sp.]|nr:MAG: hypothetical protein CM15mP116_00320 [Synechococcus sp.]
MKRSWLVLVVVLCLAFGLRALLLIDATALWSDELYSVGKSFQPSFSSLLAMLGRHPSPGLLRLALDLGASGWPKPGDPSLVVVAGVCGWRSGDDPSGHCPWRDGHTDQGGCDSSAAGFCSPYPIRFAIEGKSYAVLVLLVALAWWWRRAAHPIAYGVVAGLAGLTHFYGLFLVLAAAAWDGWQRRWRFVAAALIGALRPWPGWATPRSTCSVLGPAAGSGA